MSLGILFTRYDTNRKNAYEKSHLTRGIDWRTSVINDGSINDILKSRARWLFTLIRQMQPIATICYREGQSLLTKTSNYRARRGKLMFEGTDGSKAITTSLNNVRYIQ